MRIGGCAGVWLGLVLVSCGWMVASAQTVPTTTVQGTVYLANGTPGSGTVLVSWPAFTTAASQQVAAGSTVVTVGADGFLSVNLAANLGSNPAGLYYTAVFHLADGTVNTQFWVVPAAATASLASVQAQLMPAAQAVQTVSKAYVDQAISELQGSLLTANGGTLTGPLTLCCDPTAPLQAADKHYVDEVFSQGISATGGDILGPLTAPALNGVFAPEAGSSQTTLQATQTAAAAVSGSMVVPAPYAGTDTFTNAAGIRVEDMRAAGAQQHERSVKEFGAVCDGVTDDTAALQSAINFAQGQLAAGHGIALTLPAGVCKTQQLVWHGESIGGQGRQVSALRGFPGQDVLATATDAVNLPSQTRLHDFTIYVDASVDASCSPAAGRAAAGGCGVNRPMEANSVFSPGGNGLTGTPGSGAARSIGNCAIAMQAATGAGGNGLKVAEIENLAIASVGTDPLSVYKQANSTHTCGIYLGQWPQWSEFRNIDIRGVGTGVAVPAVAGATALGVTADSNRWQNVTIQAVHGFVAAAGSSGVLDNVVADAWASAATGEWPTGLVLDFAGSGVGVGWTARNVFVAPEWVAVQPALTVHASGGAVASVTVGPEHGLGFEAYGVSVPLLFSGSCTAAGTASVNADGSLNTVTVTAGGVGCSGTTTAAVNVAGTWVPAKAVNLVSGTQMTFLGGNLLKGVGGYSVWNAAASRTTGTQRGGGGTLTASATTYPALVIGASAEGGSSGFTGSANRFEGLGLAGVGVLQDGGLGNSVVQAAANGTGVNGIELTRLPGGTVSADFALLGGGAANSGFSSLNDLFFSPEDLYSPTGESVAAGSLFGKDTAAPVTGSYVKAVGGAWDFSGVWNLRGIANFLVLGKSFPVGSGTWVVAAKADAATTQELKLLGSSGSTSCTFADQTVSLTTGWQVFRIPYNTVTGITACDSGTQGNPVTAEGLTPGVATNVETAWVAFVPAFQQLLIANQPTQANQAANKGYQYTLRMRIYCPEVERITQAYRVVGDSGLVEFGGGGVVAQGHVFMDVVEFVDGVAGTPVVLYDGAVGYLPGAFTVVPASSLNLIGTMRSFYMKGLGTEWVSSTVTGGTAATTPVGTLADGAQCHMARTGSLTFYTGYAPALGTVVAAQYRTTGRAVGRAVNMASQAALAAAGSPASAVWIGTVTGPKGRSSRDCRNAAAALVTAASSVSAAWSGSYRTSNFGLAAVAGGVDVWPGDALLLDSASLDLDAQVVVRAVALRYAASDPDLVQYAIEFSNDWANDLAVKTSRAVPADAWLPAAIAPAYLANLNGLTVTAITAGAVSLAAGVTAPTGGGFEVRRRDFAFAAGNDADLVIRSVAPNFDIPRATESDRFYLRMYDGSTPPNYSEFSVGLFVNLPLTAFAV